jgi:hypothetical protein
MTAKRKALKWGLLSLAPLAAAGMILLGPAAAKDTLHKGEPYLLGKGTAHTWIVADLENRPMAVGVSASARAMRRALPTAFFTRLNSVLF